MLKMLKSEYVLSFLRVVYRFFAYKYRLLTLNWDKGAPFSAKIGIPIIL
jgi:hypothetical protein